MFAALALRAIAQEPPDGPGFGPPPGPPPEFAQQDPGPPDGQRPDDKEAAKPGDSTITNTLRPIADNTQTATSDAVSLSPGWSSTNSTGSISNKVRMNFNNAPIGAVLNYLSDTYGLMITGQTGVRGTVSVIANTPIGYKDAVDLVNNALTRNGYQAVVTGHTLAVMSISDAKKSAGTPVIANANPDEIPQNDTVVTQIIPVQSLNPTQLSRDLQALVPDRDTLTPNEGGNALIMTAPQSDIHRIAEVIKALDSTSVSDVKVFLLRYADSKSVAQELKDIFTDPNAQQNNVRNFMRMRFGGGGGPFGGGPFGGGGGGGGGADNNTSSNPIHVNAVADEQNNAVLVSAPSGLIESVSNLISQLDVPSEDVTAIRVFHLKHADPTETADELQSLFPDDTSSSNDNSNRGMGFRFFGGGPFGGGNRGGGSAQSSDRMKRKGKVLAVADRRTDSVIVTASRDLMSQIASMVDELDRVDAHQDMVSSFQIGYADPSEIQTLMQDLFQGTSARPSASSTASTALQQRTTQNAQQQSTSSSSSSFGGGSGTGTQGLR
jgi:general secretion pathway protein D